MTEEEKEAFIKKHWELLSEKTKKLLLETGFKKT